MQEGNSMTQSPKRAASSAHKEIVLEDHLVSQLVTQQKYIDRTPPSPVDQDKVYDRALALDKDLMLRFIHSTQKEEWHRLLNVLRMVIMIQNF